MHEQLNSFSNKKEKPTTEEYLNVGLSEVLDRLNNNPSRLQSEEAFVCAVITVRNAMIIEKLNKWLICLTAIVASATVLLVGVPFIVPTFEAQQLTSKIDATQSALSSLQRENATLLREVQEMKQALSSLNGQDKNINLRSNGSAQNRAAP